MTDLELASELAMLEGVEQKFDSTVKDIIEVKRREAMQKILGPGGRAPSEVMKDVQMLEAALEKIDQNIRGQFHEFLSAYVAARATALTSTELKSFICTLREQPVRDYFDTLTRLNKQLNEPVGHALTVIVRRAVTGTG